MNHRHYPDLDTNRDALALYRAALAGDAEGQDAILGGTRCTGCLTVSVLQNGIWLRILADPEPVVDLDTLLADVQREMIGDA